jgi:transglutaminase-like putative cysteine protease
MLSNVSDIDISPFNEGFNVDILLDAFYEAYYQNPLILGVAGLETIPGTTYLRIYYEQDQAELARKQEEIIAEVARIIDEIITPGMSDLEKQIAINDYLCETAVYDYDALDNAVANDMQPDISFRDSFTPYGVLIKRVGVCASYASAYKLLANAAGLDCVVVTGYLNGYLPHAWNRVKIGNDWLTIDVTNNGNPGLLNILLNLPDAVAAPILLEDDLYILNNRFGEFTAASGENEYYRYTGRYFAKDEIASELAAAYSADGSVTLRTDYDLSENELSQILVEMVGLIDDRATLTRLRNARVMNAWGVIYIE